MTTTAFEQGAAAFLQDRTTASCEHPLGSGQGREWVRGWTASQITERAKASEERRL